MSPSPSRIRKAEREALRQVKAEAAKAAESRMYALANRTVEIIAERYGLDIDDLTRISIVRTAEMLEMAKQQPSMTG